MNNLMRKLAGLENIEPDQNNKENNNTPNVNKNIKKGSVGFQITNGFILFGLIIVWTIILSPIKAMGVEFGFIGWLIVFGSLILVYERIIKSRKKRKDSVNGVTKI